VTLVRNQNKAGADDASVPSAPLTYLEMFSRAKSRNKTNWLIPPMLPCFQGSRPGGCLPIDRNRRDQTTLTRFLMVTLVRNQNKAGADDASVPSAPLTYLEMFSRAKSKNKTNWLIPPMLPWFQGSRPGGCLPIDCNRCDQTTLTRFLRGHIRSLTFSDREP
ncbi:hypothetical protein AVEN_199610-1, partial [Araneus ventricosus]